MAFKLRSGKTPTTFMEGTAPNKLAKEKAVAKMKEAAAAKKKMEDGRAGSSAFQQKDAEEGKKLRTYLAKVEAFLDKGFSQKEAEQMVKSGADLPNQKKGVSKNDFDDTVASKGKDKKKGKKSSPNKQKDQGDFEPAYPGADYSKEQIAKMTKKEKEQKIDGYDPKLDGVKKGKIVYKDGKKFYQASDGSLHTGQVEDYERELKVDKEMKKGKKPSPNKQAKPDFLDLDGDGDKTESMKKAAADKKGSPSKQTKKQREKLPPNLVKEIAKAKGNESPAKQNEPKRIKIEHNAKEGATEYVTGGRKGDKKQKSVIYRKNYDPSGKKVTKTVRKGDGLGNVTRKDKVISKTRAKVEKKIRDVFSSPAKQKSKLLPSEHPDTYVYDGNLHIEKVNDLEDRISFIREDMFNETGDSVQQKKDIATLQKQLKKLKANKPKASAPNKMKSPAKQKKKNKNKPMVQGGKFLVQPEIRKPERRGIPERPAYLGKLVKQTPKFEQREYEPMMVGRYPDPIQVSNSKKKKTKVGKFLSKITKRKKKK